MPRFEISPGSVVTVLYDSTAKWRMVSFLSLKKYAGCSDRDDNICSFCSRLLWICKLIRNFFLLQDKHKIFMAKYYCVRLHSLFGTALAAGLLVSRMFPKLGLPSIFGFS